MASEIKSKVLLNQGDELIALYRTGKTQSEVAKKYNIGVGTFNKYLKHRGVATSEGGLAVRTAKRRQREEELKDEYHIKVWGCTRAELKALNLPESVKMKYKHFKCGAKRVGVWGEGISIVQWIHLWGTVGRRFKEHKVTRKTKSKPVSVENCTIAYVPKDQHETVFKRYLDGESDASIGRSYGVSMHCIKRLRDKNGVRRND
jgi:transposase